MGDIADMAAEDEILYGPYGTYDPDDGHTELAGGWCIPNSQMTEWPFGPRGLPITAVRGGIKYPKPGERTVLHHWNFPTTERNTMTRMTKAQIANELRLNTELMDTLRRSRAFLEQQARTAIPVEPHNFTMFTVSVKFKMRGKSYQYLILRNGTMYFTTGTKDGQKMFATWEALCAWLEGPDVYSHTDIEILQSAGKVVSFDSGAIEKLPMQQPPF